jgi:hypothetical protein
MLHEEDTHQNCEHVRGIFGKPWTVRDVFRFRNEAELKRLTEERCGYRPGATQFMGSYQQIIGEEFKRLEKDDPEGIKDLLGEADEWNRTRPPKDEQQK